MTKPTKITIFFLLLGMLVSGQNMLPPVYNYSLFDYKGASKNWDLTTNEAGELFVANDMGLLHFNGEQWHTYKLPNNTIIRSVLSSNDRIYTGSYEEFGFWKKNKKGNLEYNSLTHLIQGHEFTSEEFWEILPFKDAIIFRSFSAIYMYENNKIKIIDPTQVVSDFIEFDGRLFVTTGSDGFFELKGDTLQSIEETLFKKKTLTDMTVVEEGLLIGSKLEGCFIFDGKAVMPWESPLNKELKLHQLSKVKNLGNGKLAFGTIKNGVYLYDSKTGTSQIINKNTGLQNNTVLSMLLYKDQLWLGLDNGIARVKLDNAITYYTDYSGALGTVYDMAFYNNTLFLGSNTGVFYFDASGLNFVNGSQGHVWDLAIIDKDLICGHNTGTYSVKQGSFEKISNITGGYKIVKVPEQKDLYLQGTYNGLATYRKTSDGNWEINWIMGLASPVKQLCFENPKILWVAHPYKGFYRLHLDDAYRTILRIEEFNGESVPSNYNVKIYKVKNQIVLSSKGHWLKYDAILGEIVPFPEFRPFKDHELLSHKNEYLWFVENEGNKDVIRTNFRKDSLLIADLSLRKRLIPDSQRVIQTNDSIAYITLGDGFAKVNIAKLRRQWGSNQLPVPELTFVKDKSNAVIPVAASHSFSFKSSRILEIGFATPRLIQPRYYYTLTGPEQHTGYVEGGSVSFQNLSWGDYTFAVSTVGVDDKMSETSSFTFSVAPPWFLSNISMVFYLLWIVATVFLIRRYNRIKLNRKQRELEAQMQKEQDKRMAQLEREKLEKEVKLKQNELASTALNIARKNEMILELKNMLVLNKDKFPNSQRYRSFMRKLNSSVKDTEDWKRFEVSFKELHEDFFERLLGEYPTLTPKDLKLCAYLKMNFSSKEIAPLMGITIRGVEIHRYRLRKKLRLESTKNLSKFLITFS